MKYQMQSRKYVKKIMTKKSFSNKCKGSSITKESINVIHHINRLMELKANTIE